MRRAPLSKYYEPEKLARVGNLQLLARTVVEGYVSGLHKSPFKGFSVEFAEYREYIPGDDLKHFDWKVFARTDKKYIREYEEETNMTCTLLLDASGSMGYGSGNLTKFDYACHLSAALTYLMIQQRDKVGLVLFDRDVRERIPPGGTPAHMKHTLDRLEHARPRGRTGVAKSLHAIAESTRRRGLVIVISDLVDDQDEVFSAIQHFRHDKHEVIVFNVLDAAEIHFPFWHLTEFRDMETNQRLVLKPRVVRDQYLKNFESFVNFYEQKCAASHIDYEMVNTKTPYELMLAAYLAKRERTR